MSLILAYQDRGLTKDLTILDGDGGVITPGANDRVRIIIGRASEIVTDGDTVTGAKLTFTSGTPTANGSKITKGAANRMRLDASDLKFDRGTYSLWFDYFDNADAREWKNISRQVFQLEES